VYAWESRDAVCCHTRYYQAIGGKAKFSASGKYHVRCISKVHLIRCSERRGVCNNGDVL